jgi:hypothetical protein
LALLAEERFKKQVPSSKKAPTSQNHASEAVLELPAFHDLKLILRLSFGACHLWHEIVS